MRDAADQKRATLSVYTLQEMARGLLKALSALTRADGQSGEGSGGVEECRAPDPRLAFHAITSERSSYTKIAFFKMKPV